MWRDDATLLDIAQAARRVIAFVEGVDEASFIANAEKHWAVVAQLLVIGEAVRRLSSEFTASHPEIEWSRIAACATASSMVTTRFGGNSSGERQQKPYRGC
ncbi:MAG: hypothetical protein KatS3mg058_4239 [Roseiflexus sp.]|nr:HepT-like ribonuclease domain-containing protein [Roseiflexus sp.]GIW02836.1 MAG: hypothetical protein KatS3mg058_4239 [Roseiflexus sp.]